MKNWDLQDFRIKKICVLINLIHYLIKIILIQATPRFFESTDVTQFYPQTSVLPDSVTYGEVKDSTHRQIDCLDKYKEGKRKGHIEKKFHFFILAQCVL